MSYPTEERPISAEDTDGESVGSGPPGEGEIGRNPRPRRRRGGRRTAAAERADAAPEGQADAEQPAAPLNEDNSVIEVEPDLEAAQRVESYGVKNGEVTGSIEAALEPPAVVDPELPLPANPMRQVENAPTVAQPPRSRYQQGYTPGQQQRGQQNGQQRQAQQRPPRPQPLPPGVPSAAALDELEQTRPVAAPRQEPQGDLALLLRGFEDIQQRNTERILGALRQVGGSDAGAQRSLNVTERIGVFVDVPNLVYAARYLNRWIDFGRLLERLLSGRRLIRAHAYSPTDPDPSAEQQFLTPVKSQGFRLTTKNYRTFASGAKKADMDLDLCMDVVRLVVAKAIDCLVLCSGDGDFLPLLDFCADNGVRVEVASFVEATSDELRQACDRFYNLSAMEGIRLSRPLGANS